MFHLKSGSTWLGKNSHLQGDGNSIQAVHLLLATVWRDSCENGLGRVGSGDGTACQNGAVPESCEPCQRRIILGTSVVPTPRDGTWGQGAGGAGPARSTSPNQGLFSCRQWLWKDCLQLQVPTEKDKGNGCTEIPGALFFFLFLWPEATEVGQTAKPGISQSSLSFSKVLPSPTSAPTCYFCISLFPSLLLGQMQFGKKQAVAAPATAAAEVCFQRRMALASAPDTQHVSVGLAASGLSVC